MAAPNIPSTVTSSETTAVTSHDVTLPGSLAIGEWVVVCFGHNNISPFGSLDAAAFPTDDYWAVTPVGSATTTFMGAIGVHEVNGRESWYGAGSPAIVVTTPDAVVSAHVAARCQCSGVTVTMGTFSSGSSAPNPPAAVALYPDNETSVAVIGIAGFVGIDATTFTVSAYPTNYTDDQTTVIDDDGSDFVRVAIGCRSVTATGNVDPGAFTTSVTLDSIIPFTVLLFPTPDFSTALGNTHAGLAVQLGITDELMLGYPIRWVDITGDVRALGWHLGRNHELNAMEAGTANLTLDNRAGAYTPGNVSGTHYPYIRSTCPMRIVAKVIATGAWAPQFTGYVERWPLQFPGNTDSVVQVTAVDAFKLMNAEGSTPETRTEVMTELAPIAWWQMGTASAPTAISVDSATPGGHTLNWVDVTADEQPGAWQGDQAVSLDGNNDYATIGTEDDIELRADMSFEIWHKPINGSGGGQVLLTCNASGSDHLYELYWSDNPPSGDYVFTPTYADLASLSVLGVAPADEWAHVVVTLEWGATERTIHVYANGEEAALAGSGHTLPYQPPVSTRTCYIGRRSAATLPYAGLISEVSFYDYVLTAEQASRLYHATVDQRAEELTGTRIRTALDDMGYGPRAIDDGQTVMIAGAAQSNVKAEIDQATETDGGYLYMDGSGVATFHDRHHRLVHAAATSYDIGLGGDFDYVDLVASEDEDHLYTRVVVTDSAGAPHTVEDADARALHGVRRLERTSQAVDTTEADGLASYLLGAYSDDVVRVDSVTFGVGKTATQVLGLLSAQLGNRYRLTKAMSGDDIDIEVYLEAVTHSVAQSHEWICSWQLSPADPQSYWVLGDSVLGKLGTTTRLAY